MSTLNPSVDAFVGRTKSWRAEIQKLRSILLEGGLDEDIKWGKPCFSFEGKNVAIIQPFTFGDAPRNLPSTRTERLFSLDLSVLKDIPIVERWKLQFRAEAFNATNTVVFGNPGTNRSAGNFGVISGFATNYDPRRIQLALKLVF